MKKIGMFKDNKDGTIKCVYNDINKIIEISLLFNKKDRDVVCVPTHNFCSLGCKMCHLTNNKLNKSMIPIKYDDFIICLLDCLKYFHNKEKLLISFMGVGEPLLNLELIKNVYLNENIIKEKYRYKEICYSLSTMMPNENINILIDLVKKYSIPLKVHFSLHTPFDEKRFDLIPSTNVSIKKAFDLLDKYRKEITKDKKIINKFKNFHSNINLVELHYTLINNVNDSDEELNELIIIETDYKIPIKFIRFNPKDDLKQSKKEESWIKTLSKIDNLVIKRYSPPGREVGSSCGEFTKHYYHEEIETKEEKKEFNKWKKEHEIFD